MTKDYNKITNDLQLGGDDLDLYTISRECIAQKLKEININKSPGPFDPPTKIIKHFAEQLSGPLTDIINTFFQEKCFGEIWKAYNCCPIPKSNPCTTVGDIYRPIALTSVFSKIQESFALDWILEDSRDCLSERQFGGIPRSSSVLALLEMLHTWFVALEKPKSVIRIVFLDFSKAFDLIDHNILLNDFKSVGVHPALLPWLASYLSDRLQRVTIDGSTSCFKKINAGVPQGGKIGPIAFITKINKLPDLALTDKNSGKEYVSIFMDDTTLSEILNINNPETQPVSNIQANVERISKFSREENMRLNLKKTEEMVIDLRIMKSEIPVITIDNIPIERIQSHKLLGIWLQSDLKWHTDTFFIIKKARKRL